MAIELHDPISNTPPQTTAAKAASVGRSQEALSPGAIIRIKNLELRAKVVVEGFMSGLHRSPYHGFSVEFTDYRQYSPGDDLRYLDWKLLARGDRKYIKRFEDETNLRCYLLVDFSRSMNFQTQSYSKIQYATTVAATLAYFLNRQRDAVGLLTFEEKILEVIPPRFRAGHLRRLMLGLERSTVGKSTNLSAPLQQIASTVRKRGLVVLLSDFLTPIENLQKDLGYLRSQGHDVIVLRILDPAEVTFPFSKAQTFQDLETGKQLFIDPEVAGKQYRQRFGEHQLQIQKTCENLGVNFFQITTDQPLDQALFDLIQVRTLTGQVASHRTSRNAASIGGAK